VFVSNVHEAHLRLVTRSDRSTCSYDRTGTIVLSGFKTDRRILRPLYILSDHHQLPSALTSTVWGRRNTAIIAEHLTRIWVRINASIQGSARRSALFSRATTSLKSRYSTAHEVGSVTPASSCKMLFLSTLLSFFFYFSSIVTAADTSAWKSRSIYFVLTDRVARSSSDTGGSSCSNLGNYCGGTFKGLESKLDYIQGLGFDAIWITPVVASEYL
jgi:hypothetical protein